MDYTMNNNDIMETRRRKAATNMAMGADNRTDSLSKGDFDKVKKFPCAWTFGVMSSCLFFTVILMPFLALNLPTAPRDDLPWWQKASIYQIKTREFQDSSGDGVSDIRGITKSAEHLQWLGVAGVLLDSLFPKTEDDITGVTNYYQVDPKLGTIADVEEMIDILHKRGVRVMLDLEINHSHRSHPWFGSSQRKDPKYRDYYVWSDGTTDSDGQRQPPNNWLSISGGSAWSFDNTRQQYYLHQFHHSLPDLNFHNSDVVTEIEKIMQFWLGKGVDGFSISHADYLVETTEVSVNEPRSCDHDALPNEYRYLLHPYTRQVPFVHNLTMQWRGVLDKHQTPNRHLLLLLDAWPFVEGEDLETWNEHNQGKTQLALNYALSQTLTNQVPCGGTCLSRHVAEVRDLGAEDTLFAWTALKNGDTLQETGSYASVYDILVLLLPGTPVTQASQGTMECHQQDSNSLKVVPSCQQSVLLKRLHEVRQEPAFLWGRLEYAVQNENIFSFFRHAKGWSYTKFLVTVNVGDRVSNDSYINSSPHVKCPVQGTVVAVTKSHSDRTDSVSLGDRVFLNNLRLYPGEGFVVALK